MVLLTVVLLLLAVGAVAVGAASLMSAAEAALGGNTAALVAASGAVSVGAVAILWRRLLILLTIISTVIEIATHTASGRRNSLDKGSLIALPARIKGIILALKPKREIPR